MRAAASAPVHWIEETGCWFAGADGRPARVQGIVRINNERHARDEQLLKLSRHDPLTGELNRTHLIASLAEAIEETERFRSSCAFMLIGIDHLARVNDAFGFDMADAVISEIARRIRVRLRGGDVLGRFSGNKFGMILKNCTIDDMNIAAERFLAGVRDEVVPTASGPVSITVSIGGGQRAAPCPHRRRSDQPGARRRWIAPNAAAPARSRLEPNVERDAQRRVNIRVTDEIVTALNERRIVVAFEPVVAARLAHAGVLRMSGAHGGMTARAAGARHRAGGRETRLIRLVDHRVLELVVAELVGVAGGAQPQISPETTMDPEWWATIESAMHAYPGVAERLIVEITETVGDPGHRRCPRLRLALEELRLPDCDRRFRRRLHLVPQPAQARRRHHQDRRRLRAEHRALGRRSRLRADADRPGAPANIKTVAEWVQDEESALLLRDWGCDYIQGRLIGLAYSDSPWSTPSSQRAWRGELASLSA